MSEAEGTSRKAVKRETGEAEEHGGIERRRRSREGQEGWRANGDAG